MEKNATIFLDIDGVLNIIGDMYTTQIHSSFLGERHLIARLNYLFKYVPFVDIVISSTRKIDMPKLIRELEDSGFKYCDRIVGKTSTMCKRGQEIQEYIDTFNIVSYIVIDDNITQINGIDGKFIPLDNIIHTNPAIGIEEQQILTIIKRLNKDKNGTEITRR
jgi:hypothetical protein